GRVFLSSEKIPLTTSLSPTPISLSEDATASFASGFSGGTRLYTVLSESVTFSMPSFVCRTILPASIEVTSPGTIEGFMFAVWENEEEVITPRTRIKYAIEIKLRNFINTYQVI